jgi:hypothetical protein
VDVRQKFRTTQAGYTAERVAVGGLADVLIVVMVEVVMESGDGRLGDAGGRRVCIANDCFAWSRLTGRKRKRDQKRGRRSE